MSKKNYITRGNRHYFVCRVPHDLLHFFPNSTIWKSLHTTEKKNAAVVASAYEYQTQQLFMQLRSSMLTPDLEKRLVASYLLHGAALIQTQATGSAFIPPAPASPLDSVFESEARWHHKGRHLAYALAAAMAADGVKSAEASGDAEAVARAVEYAKTRTESGMRTVFKDSLLEEVNNLPEYLVDKDTEICPIDLDYLAGKLKKLTGVRLTESDKKTLGLKLIDAQIQLFEAEAATLEGNWTHARTLQATAESALETQYITFAEAVAKYQDYYRASKLNVKAGTIADMEVECRILQEIVGSISIVAFNSMTTVTNVKLVLRKYPLNRLQRYGMKPLKSILKLSGYDIIQPKTANEYIKRAKAIVAYALKSQMMQSSNVWESELFQTEVAEEEQRSAYDKADVERLNDAICTKPLWRYNPPKPERFWLILIAILHGLRLGNIVGLTKLDVCQNDAGLWVLRLRSGKTKSTVRDVAINDCLLLLGFLEWVQGLQRTKLFQDSAASFSAFYNRSEVRKDGYVSEGFEAKYITKDPKKCLYSLRHSFAGEVYGVSIDYKLTADMMGHSTDGKVTARYMKSLKTEQLKAVSDKLAFLGLDLNKLEARAIELFGLI